MNNHSKSRSAFTLIEMLTVIVIIALLAAALLAGLRSAQEQAHSALCQARMKNLHQACMNHLTDTGYYPFAGSFEWKDLYKNYHENKGWVAWIRADGKAADAIKSPWAEDPKKPHGKDYLHAGWSGEKAIRAIREGSIFKYASRDLSAYVCPRFSRKHFQNSRADVRRTYVMNAWFGSRRSEPSTGRRLIDFNNAGIEPSRMGYLAELDSAKDENPKGEDGGDKVGSRKNLAVDSVWEHADDERYGLYHRKSGNLHGHVIFVDGHIESLTDRTNQQGDDYQTQNQKTGTGKH